MIKQALPSVAVGADHGGYPLKEQLKAYLSEKGYRVIDCGTDSTASVDYPVFARKVAETVSTGAARFGIMVDGAGIGSSMVANKIPGVRAALCYDESSANNAREHNDANLLTLGAGLIGSNLAKLIVQKFLTVECTVDRHKRRVEMINDLDNRGSKSGPTIQPKGDVSVDTIAHEDAVRIANRVLELMNQSGIVGTAQQGAICGDDVCTNCGLCASKSTENVRDMIGLGAGRITYSPGGEAAVPEDIARFIDHTILKPDATEADIKKVCAEAREYNFASVCVNPTWVPLVKRELDGSDVDVCTVVGFPLGTHMSDVKAMETRRAIRDGAKEIDMVINIGALKSGDTETVYRDIRAVVEACEDGGALSKVIIETALLTDEEKRIACELSKRARADYVKTSTGFAGGGATAEDVELMKRTVADSGMGVKASGGIRDYDSASEMIKSGATRIGASAGIKIVQGSKQMTVSN
jgi:deoxyribose-phosphate aldolase